MVEGIGGVEYGFVVVIECVVVDDVDWVVDCIGIYVGSLGFEDLYFFDYWGW